MIRMDIKCLQAIVSFVGADLRCERGGILGWKNGGIRYFFPDTQAKAFCDTYTPSMDLLNMKRREWARAGIEFCGIIHSHIAADARLSRGDKNYILRILQTMGGNRMFFPVAAVTEDGVVVNFYSAWLQNNELCAAEDCLMFV